MTWLRGTTDQAIAPQGQESSPLAHYFADVRKPVLSTVAAAGLLLGVTGVPGINRHTPTDRANVQGDKPVERDNQALSKLLLEYRLGARRERLDRIVNDRGDVQLLLQVMPELASDILGRTPQLSLSVSDDPEEGTSLLVVEIATGIQGQERRGEFEDLVLNKILARDDIRSALDVVAFFQV